MKPKGGKREGAGRKPASYEHKSISFRVRLEWIEEIKEVVKIKIEELKK